MKKEKIEELYGKNATELIDAYDCYGCAYDATYMRRDGFTQAINQAELEWYKKLEKRLGTLFEFQIVALSNDEIAHETYKYYNEIQNKIKELENGN